MRKMLIITQKVDINDPVLGFFHRWIVEFSKHFDTLLVICLYKGQYSLPNNVRVLSMGKEDGDSRIKYIKNLYKYIWKERNNYDEVFVHMNPIYVLLGVFFWKMNNKDIFLWYTHKNVDLKLRLAEKFVKNIFTASKASFRIKSDKVIVTGHGIDISSFPKKELSNSDNYNILTLGRISQTKNQLILIRVMKNILDRGFKSRLVIVGDSITKKDEIYKNLVIKEIDRLKLNDMVSMVGSVKPSDIYKYYSKADLFVNLSNTGSMDKTILEAMASQTKILTSNEAFKDILPDDNFTTNNHEAITEKIINLFSKSLDPNQFSYVLNNHNVTNLIKLVSEKIK
jgi:glycosyltransferase involved in cell wall biosynthesis